MAGVETPSSAAPAPELPPGPPFYVAHQDVSFSVDFVSRRLIGHTAIEIEPASRDLKEIKLKCRQIEIKRITVDGRPVPTFRYEDPYKKLTPLEGYGINQHHLISERVDKAFFEEADLIIPLPKPIRFAPSYFQASRPGLLKLTLNAPETPKPADDGTGLRHFFVNIDFVVKTARDGLHWVGIQPGDDRYPHVFTYTHTLPNVQSNFVFPCNDNFGAKHTWRLTFETPRTLGDIGSSISDRPPAQNGDRMDVDGEETQLEAYQRNLSEEDKALDIAVVCSGYMEESDVSQIAAFQFTRTNS